MPLKKIKKAAKAVVEGTKDYSRKMKAVDKAAEKTAGKSGSRVTDVKNQQKIRKTVKKKQNLSLKNSIKRRYKM